jgi:uncharacterized protein (DUF1330 family)
MSAYGVGILRDVELGPAIVEYLERIDGTLAPFDGHFIVHGGERQMREGDDPGTLVVIEFPDMVALQAWYASDAYQALIPLRAENSVSTVFFVDGVDREHRATDVLAARYDASEA